MPGIGQVAPEIDRRLDIVTVARWFAAKSDELVVEGAGEEPLSPKAVRRAEQEPRSP